MSEPIQSIATGTYMIGETTNINFEAGPGISITQPSEGTVRIANDETVLWESSVGVTNNITLSEDIGNFEFIRVEWCPYTEASNWAAPYDVILTKVKDGLLHLSGWSIANDGLAQVMTNLLLTCSNTTVTVYKSGTIVSLANGTSTSSLTGYKLYKIVGINRISGGNI